MIASPLYVRMVIAGLVLVAVAMNQTPAMAGQIAASELVNVGINYCKSGGVSSIPALSGHDSEGPQVLQRGQRTFGQRFELVSAGSRVVFDALGHPLPRRYVIRSYRSLPAQPSEPGDPEYQVIIDLTCTLQSVKQMRYHADGRALSVVTLDDNLNNTTDVEWLNPPLPVAQPVLVNDDQLRVALVDSGVDYRLPGIFSRLAKDGDGQLIGYDFWDQDQLPFDAHPTADGFNIQRHGTRTASIFLREAPDTSLVPYRYPRPDMSRMADLVQHAATNNVVAIGLPLGGNRAEEWREFQRVVEQFPDMLFIASAGNNGRDIDLSPVYPAALDLPNMLVVTSADDFVRPASGVNWGRFSVDFLVPAEDIPAIGYNNIERNVSGSSYAVARVLALAARSFRDNPDWTATDLIEAFRQRYASDHTRRWVRSGYIADPLADTASVELLSASSWQSHPTRSGENKIALDVRVLDARWTQQRIDQLLGGALDIIEQCSVVAGAVTVSRWAVPDYLRHLATGSAKTLFEKTDRPMQGLTVVLADDTRMATPYTGEAFGLANTQSRPWLRQSVWLTEDIEDPAIALAHELVHVLTNNGEHVTESNNLMQSRTSEEAVTLNPAQCAEIQEIGLQQGLLQ